MPLPINHLSIGEGLGPQGSGTARFYVDLKDLEVIENEGPEWKFHDARLVCDALQNPQAIFEGLQRHGHRDGLCYSSRPAQRWVDESTLQAAPVGYVFLVFLYESFHGYVVFDWEWRKEDPDTPGHPQGFSEDFARRIWAR